VAFPGCKEKEKEEETTPASQEKALTKVVLTCGMAGHPEFAPGEEPADGNCPQCGMKLVKKEVPVEQPAETYWTCPMHPEVKEKGPGNCPQCGMKLVEKETPKPTTE
jgi:DNA-directed RNA polymerase subunit RPC12/RpoP